MLKKEQYDRRKAEDESRRKEQLSRKLSHRLRQFSVRLIDPSFIIQALLVGCTGGLIYVGFLQKQTLDEQRTELANTDRTLRKSMEAASRAWLTPTHLEFLKGIDDPGGPSIMIHYQNVGHFPAIDVKTSGGWNVLPLDKPITRADAFPESAFWPEVDRILRSGCKSNKPISGGSTVFPTSNTEGHYVPSPPNPFPDLQGVKAREQIIIVTGCLTYSTFDLPRHTGFCQFASDIRITPQWEFNNCPVGNFTE
jgi:hypothetical protein